MLGMALMSAQRFEEAASAFAASSQEAPNEPKIRGNLGIALAKAGRSEEALRVLLEIAPRMPQSPELHYNLGNVYRDLARPADAAPEYACAIALRPDYADAHWNRAHSLLLMGNFAEGWNEFEWRFRLPGRRPLPFPGAVWNGSLEAVAGRTILLAGEQGFG